MPEVSVIIPTFDCGAYIGEAIESVLKQTYQDFEIIIVDDGSTDNTRELVSSFHDERLQYRYQENRGASDARNTGIKASRGKYISFLDADDVWLPLKLELQVKALESSPRIGLVYSDMYYFGLNKTLPQKTFFQCFHWNPPRGRVLNLLAERYFAHLSVVMIKRDVINQVGLFDTSLRNCQDYDFLFRVALYYEFEVIPQPLAKYRFSERQISRDTESVITCHIAFFKKALNMPLLDFRMRSKFYSRLSQAHFNYGKFCFKRQRYAKAGRELLAASFIFTKQWNILILAYLKQITGKIWLRLKFNNKVSRADQI